MIKKKKDSLMRVIYENIRGQFPIRTPGKKTNKPDYA